MEKQKWIGPLVQQRFSLAGGYPGSTGPAASAEDP